MTKLIGRLGEWRLPHVHRWSERQVELRQPRVALVTPESHVATIGSCFASELARALERLGLQGGMHPGGLFYSSRTIRQELERIFAGWPGYEAEPLWQCGGGWVHPFKDYGKVFGSAAELRAWSDELDRRAEALFRSADVIVITLGLIETWQHPARRVCYRQIPHPEVFEALGAEHHRLTVSEILEDLQRIRELVRSHTQAELVLTVSPVPLLATFTSLDVRVANTESKSRIRAAVSELLDRYDDVHYFPSYEIVTTAERMSDFMQQDGRHVSHQGVEHILGQFVRMFGDEELSHPVPESDWITPPSQTATRIVGPAPAETLRGRIDRLLGHSPPVQRLARGLWRRFKG